MRELNQKIYEIAGLENKNTDGENDESVSIGQVITDNYINEAFDATDVTLSREEANKIIKAEREVIYGKETRETKASQDLNLKKVFANASNKKPASSGKAQTKAPLKTANKTVAKKVKKNVKRPAGTKKATKQSSNRSVLLILVLAAAVAAYYFLT